MYICISLSQGWYIVTDGRAPPTKGQVYHTLCIEHTYNSTNINDSTNNYNDNDDTDSDNNHNNNDIDKHSINDNRKVKWVRTVDKHYQIEDRGIVHRPV